MSSEIASKSLTTSEAKSSSGKTIIPVSNIAQAGTANDSIKPTATSEPSRCELSVDCDYKSSISAGSDHMLGKQITPTSIAEEVELIDDDSYHNQFMDSIPSEKLLSKISELMEGYLTERTHRELQCCRSLVFNAMEEKRAAASHLTKAMKELVQYKRETSQDPEFLEHLQDMVSDAEKTYAKAVASVDQHEEELDEKLEEHEKVTDKFPTNSPRKRQNKSDGYDAATEVSIKRAKNALCISHSQPGETIIV